MAKDKKSSKLIIIPGNGCSDIRNANWYQWLADTLKSDYTNTANNLEIICETMPDPYTARAKYWIPFIKSKLESADKVYVVGHSSGAVAILRLCEELGQDIDAAFVVSACATHLGDDNEKASGYYPTQPDGTKKPWRFDLIRKKCKKLVFLSSVDDPFIPVNEPRLLAKELGLTHIEIKGDGSNSVAPPVEQNTYDGVYFEFTDGGHFMTQSLKTLRSIINAVIPI